MHHTAEKGSASEFQHGLVHKPIMIKEATNIQEAKAARSRTDGEIQQARAVRNLWQATMQTSPTANSAMSDVSSTDLVSFKWMWTVNPQYWAKMPEWRDLMREQRYLAQDLLGTSSW